MNSLDANDHELTFSICIVNTDIRGECENPTQIGFVPQIKENRGE